MRDLVVVVWVWRCLGCGLFLGLFVWGFWILCLFALVGCDLLVVCDLGLLVCDCGWLVCAVVIDLVLLWVLLLRADCVCGCVVVWLCFALLDFLVLR